MILKVMLEALYIDAATLLEDLLGNLEVFLLDSL